MTAVALCDCALQARSTRFGVAAAGSRSRSTRLPRRCAEPEAEAVSDREIGRALETLSPGQRSVVASVSVDGHSISETAQNLGMSETAVRVALHRGLAAIASRYGRS